MKFVNMEQDIMKVCELSEVQFNDLMRLCDLYHREANKCMKAKSYFAGCIMIGATLEAALIGMCHCYFEEIPERLIPKKKNGTPKHLLEWSLFQLIRVARECNWLPSGLSLGDNWCYKKAQIGDYAIVLKDFRNLIHANCYITFSSRRRITRRRMEMCFDILDTASTYLQAKIAESLRGKI
jgi:hypothetical protein